MVAGDGSGGEKWKELGRRRLLETPVLAVTERESQGPEGRRGRFIVLEAPDWATVVPIRFADGKPEVLMVRQYRHGSDEPSLEFPGGVMEAGEEPEAAAVRELVEETGYKPGRITRLASISPNPAIMSNRVHMFLAEDLADTGARNLDEHEVVDASFHPLSDIEAMMGRGECGHALMAAALFFALRELEDRRSGRTQVRLEPLRDEDFAEYRRSLVAELAEASVSAGRWPRETALAKAESEQDKVLPQGLASPGHSLRMVRGAQDGRALGRFWYGRLPGSSEPSVAFLYHFELFATERGKGLGRAAMRAALAAAAKDGFETVRLHVFKDNLAARRLYESVGFRTLRSDSSGATMERSLVEAAAD